MSIEILTNVYRSFYGHFHHFLLFTFSIIFVRTNSCKTNILWTVPYIKPTSEKAVRPYNNTYPPRNLVVTAQTTKRNDCHKHGALGACVHVCVVYI